SVGHGGPAPYAKKKRRKETDCRRSAQLTANQNATPKRRPFVHTMTQLFLVPLCSNTKRLGSDPSLLISRQAPPADISRMLQSIGGFLGSTTILPVLDTKPAGLTRTNLRFSRPAPTCDRANIICEILQAGR